MSTITSISNTAKLDFDGTEILSNIVNTDLLLNPTITKAVDVTTGAKIGDILTYTCIVTNISVLSLSPIPFTDVLPEGCEYNAGSFKVNGVTETPTYDNGTNTLTYTIPTLASLGVTTIVFTVTITG